jgi:hypothetical protein
VLPEGNTKPSSMYKYLLAASDLQLPIGLSLLISGYTKLRSGLVNYYWTLLIYLAWFSALTHPAFLTLLRSHPPGPNRVLVWRLLSMGIGTIMLTTALIFLTSAEHPKRYTGMAQSQVQGILRSVSSSHEATLIDMQ